MAEQLLVIDDIEGLESVEAYLKDKDFIALDTETTGVLRSDQIIGFSFAAEEDLGIYVQLAYWDTKTNTLIQNPELKRRAVRTMMEMRGKNLIMHNSVFDCDVIEREFGISLMPYVHTDTMILAHLLDENRRIGLKELGTQYFGISAAKEAQLMKESVLRNGGIRKKKEKEMYKADPELIARYGAKDTILTLKLFNVLVPELFEQNLDKFFYDEESMPLLRGPTYQLNTKGLKVDVERLRTLEVEMEHEIKRLHGEIMHEISPYIKDIKGFKITSKEKLAWLLFVKLGCQFKKLNDSGRELARDLIGKTPYMVKEKNQFIRAVNARRAEIEANLELAVQKLNEKKLALRTSIPKGTKRDLRSEMTRANKEVLKPYEATVKKLRSQAKKMSPEKYIKADKAVLKTLAPKYDWVKKLLKMRAEDKLLGTYVRGIQKRLHYGLVFPSFKQTGTTSGRYSSVNPNFQSLPRDDKRVKSAILARPGRSFIGADYSQLEPRVFASVSQDPALLECFASGKDFYSVVGIKIFKKFDASPFKDDKDSNSFATEFPAERQISKNSCLAAAYGTTANRLSEMLQKPNGEYMDADEAKEIIREYFDEFPSVEKMMLESHRLVKKNGVVYTLYGRPRRIPDAKKITKVYGNKPHSELPYQIRKLLNLGMNHRVQGSAASIVNRAAIRFIQMLEERGKTDSRFLDVWIALQVHDEIVADAPDEIVKEVAAVLKDAMENTTTLPGVALIAKPVIAKSLADLK